MHVRGDPRPPGSRRRPRAMGRLTLAEASHGGSSRSVNLISKHSELVAPRRCRWIALWSDDMTEVSSGGLWLIAAVSAHPQKCSLLPDAPIAQKEAAR
mmetsp:Transcript_13258/g.33748  ORF Transcript_13258/g.33748 Transcript_13258/m.33748 type:complete len:98 (+) Transcript_13258:85-378(+)